MSKTKISWTDESASPTPWSIRRVGGVWQVFDADWVMVMSFLDGTANTANVQMIVDSVNNVRAVAAELERIKRERDVANIRLEAFTNNVLCDQHTHEANRLVERGECPLCKRDDLRVQLGVTIAQRNEAERAVNENADMVDKFVCLFQMANWRKRVHQAEIRTLIRKWTQAEADARDSEQRMFELCVTVTCPFCNDGSSVVGNDKKYHIRPYAECAATYLHVRFPEHSRAMLEKLDGAK